MRSSAIDRVDAQSAADALVDQGGIGEAVREHDFAAVQRGQNPLVHVLRARGEIEQDLGGRAQFLVGRIQQNPPDFLAIGGPPGSTVSSNGAAQGTQPFRQAVHLGGLAGAVHAFEGDEDPA